MVIEPVLSIGAIYAFIPIVIIIILIAAAAGLTRGKDLFAIFGLGALIGFGGAAGRGMGKGISKGPQIPKGTQKMAIGVGGIASLGAVGAAAKAKEKLTGKSNEKKASVVRNLAEEGKANKKAGTTVTPLQQKAMEALAATNASAAGIAYQQAKAGKTALNAQAVGKAYQQANAGRINLAVSSTYNPPRIARQSGGGKRFGDITSKSTLMSKSTSRYKVNPSRPRFTVKSNVLVAGGLAGSARLADMATKDGRQRRAQEKIYHATEKDVKRAGKEYDRQLIEAFNKGLSSTNLRSLRDHVGNVGENANEAWKNMSPGQQKAYGELKPPGGWGLLIPLANIRSKKLRKLIKEEGKPPAQEPGS